MKNIATHPDIKEIYLEHYNDHIKNSAISDEIAISRGYMSITQENTLKELGFSKSQYSNLPGLLIPIFPPGEVTSTLYQYRPDKPRKNSNGKEIKYETPKGAGIRLDVHPFRHNKLKDPNTRLFITEGIKKVDSLTSMGEVAIGLLGVWNFKGKNEYQSSTFNADWDYISLENRMVYIVYDSDVMTKEPVLKACERLAEHLKRKGANVFIVQLPELEEKDKVGVDDYLASGKTVKNLIDNAKPSSEVIKSSYDSITNGTYFVDNKGYLCRYKLNKDGPIPIRLANFDAEIIHEIIKDNGAETEHFYNIEVRKKYSSEIKSIGICDVKSTNFSSMNWLSEFGTNAILEPGYSIKDYVRHAIESKSNPKTIRTYTHTGWREIDKKWCYLSADGAIGMENVNVSFSDEVKKYSIPVNPSNFEKSVKHSLSLIDIGKKDITIPLFAFTYLAPLTTIISPMPNFSLYLYGETGVFKSTLALTALSHFGDFSNISNLSNFEDTQNSAGVRSFTLKDTIMLLDDYNPSVSKYEYSKKEGMAQRMIREFSNRTERARLRQDATEKIRKSPRGMLIVTGEELVSLQSTLARLFVVEIAKGDINPLKLSQFQKNLNLLSHSMSFYINWLINKGIDNIKKNFEVEFVKLRSIAREKLSFSHSKLPEQVAFLIFSTGLFLEFSLEKNILSENDAKQIQETTWNSLLNQTIKHNSRIKNEDPVEKFKEILTTLIAQEKIHISAKNINYEMMGGELDARYKPELLGYCDDEYLYLLPQATWKEINTFSSQSGERFPATRNSLYKMLVNRNYLIPGKDGSTTVIKIQSNSIRVLKLLKNILEQEDQDDSQDVTTYVNNKF